MIGAGRSAAILRVVRGIPGLRFSSCSGFWPAPRARPQQGLHSGTRSGASQRRGALYIGEPDPGNQYRLFMVASGFVIHAKVVADIGNNAKTGQVKFSVSYVGQNGKRRTQNVITKVGGCQGKHRAR